MDNKELVEKRLNTSYDFEILKFLNCIKRNKKLIFVLSLLFFLGGYFYTISLKNIWEGTFQIVIDEKLKNKVGSGSNNPLALLEGNSKNLRTEVEILKSPSVLMPVFIFVKKSYKENGLKVDSWRYDPWFKKNLKIKLKKSTTILEITYKDKEKSLVIPVLEMISSRYKEYAIKAKKEELMEDLAYHKIQIKELSKKANKSYLELNKFAIENNFRIKDFYPNNSNSKILNKLSSDINLEDNFNTETIKNNKSQKILRSESQFIVLENLENELLEKSAFFTPESKTIKSLRMRIDKLKNSLKRSEETLLNYKKLERDAIINENNLDYFEDSYQTLLLKKAKSLNPWELISEPSLYPDPVAPRRKKLIALITLIGISISIIIAQLKERISKKIFDSEELSFYLNAPLLEVFTETNKDYSINLNSIANVIKNSSKDNNICILEIGKIENFDLTSLSSELSRKLSNKLFLNNFFELNKNDLVILVSNLDSILIEDVKKIKEKLENQKSLIIGWILIK